MEKDEIRAAFFRALGGKAHAGADADDRTPRMNFRAEFFHNCFSCHSTSLLYILLSRSALYCPTVFFTCSSTGMRSMLEAP